MIIFSYASTAHKDILHILKCEISDPVFLLQKDNTYYVFLDHREIDVFKEKNKNQNIEAVLLDTPGLAHQLALDILEKYALKNKVIEVPSYFPLDMADFLREQGIILHVKNPFRPERLIKTAEEKEAIKESIQKTQLAYKKIEEILAQSRILTNGELEYKEEILTSEILKQEADRVLFEHGLLSIEGMIIASGYQAALSHHQGSGVIQANQTIVCDLFPISRTSGYFADMTRTYVKGEPTQKMLAMYQAVEAAQKLALSMVKPGVKGKDIHEAVSNFFLEQGFDIGDRGFTHGTGHGLGLDLHELPNVNRTSETLLEPGHVVTIEPGLYYPDIGGVRLEDVVYVTQTGSENLTNYPNIFVIT